MDIHKVVQDILARASMIELREAIKTAERLKDWPAKRMFMRELERRIGDES